MVKTRKQDLVIGIVMDLIVVFCYVNTKKLPEASKQFTNIVLLATFALSTALIIYSIVKKAVPFGDEVDIKVFKNPLLAFVIITIYVLLMDKIGFFVSSAMFMVAFAFWMGYRKWVPLACTVVGMLGFVYVLFPLMLHVPLPGGLLF